MGERLPEAPCHAPAPVGPRPQVLRPAAFLEAFHLLFYSPKKLGRRLRAVGVPGREGRKTEGAPGGPPTTDPGPGARSGLQCRAVTREPGPGVAISLRSSRTRARSRALRAPGRRGAARVPGSGYRGASARGRARRRRPRSGAARPGSRGEPPDSPPKRSIPNPRRAARTRSGAREANIWVPLATPRAHAASWAPWGTLWSPLPTLSWSPGRTGPEWVRPWLSVLSGPPRSRRGRDRALGPEVGIWGDCAQGCCRGYIYAVLLFSPSLFSHGDLGDPPGTSRSSVRAQETAPQNPRIQSPDRLPRPASRIPVRRRVMSSSIGMLGNLLLAWGTRGDTQPGDWGGGEQVWRPRRGSGRAQASRGLFTRRSRRKCHVPVPLHDFWVFSLGISVWISSVRIRATVL